MDKSLIAVSDLLEFAKLTIKYIGIHIVDYHSLRQIKGFKPTSNLEI